MTYDPNQPRDPAGTSTGGQWTTAGDAARRAAGLQTRAEMLAAGKRSSLPWPKKIKHGRHKTEMLEVEGVGQAVRKRAFKGERTAQNEVAAGQIAEEFPLVDVPVVVLENEEGFEYTVQEFATIKPENFYSLPDPTVRTDFAVWDAVIDNNDRMHETLGPGHERIALDNGEGFNRAFSDYQANPALLDATMFGSSRVMNTWQSIQSDDAAYVFRGTGSVDLAQFGIGTRHTNALSSLIDSIDSGRLDGFILGKDHLLGVRARAKWLIDNKDRLNEEIKKSWRRRLNLEED